ncbi:hypothetical protein LCGC14_2098730, partial [marine sediment metagenome]
MRRLAFSTLFRWKWERASRRLVRAALAASVSIRAFGAVAKPL